MHGFFNLRIDEQAAPVRDVSGIDAAIQLGFRAPHKISFGLALSAHLPDDSIARIGFRPGTEPQFFRYEAVLQRAAFDIVAAGKKGPVALGVGAAFALDMGGPGTSFNLAQDAQGTYADAASDIRLAYRVAPLVGLSLDFRRISFGAMYRGALAIDLSINSEIRIALNENPLNGTTSIAVRGAVLRAVLRDLARNPLLIAVLLGIATNVLNIAPIPVLSDMAKILGAAALPIMLLCVGANIRIRAMTSAGLPVALSVVGKMVVFPAMILVAAQFVDLSDAALLVLILYGAVPTAASAYTLARQMGGDAPVMATIITLQTALSFVTLPITVALVQWLGAT